MKKKVKTVKEDNNVKKLDNLLSAKWLIFYVVIILVFSLISLGFDYFINIPKYMNFLSEYVPNEVNVVILNGFNKIILLSAVCIVQFMILGIFSISLVKKIAYYKMIIDNFEKPDS